TPRYGIGIQQSPYIEIGLSRLVIYNDLPVSSSSWCVYSSAELNYRNKDKSNPFFYGVKLGFESSSLIGMWGIDIKYQTDFDNSLFIITPKGGLSLAGVVNILYGYNL